MGLQDKYDFSQIENEAEKLVIKEIELSLPEEEWEEEEFIMDVATYALNHLKPAYSHTLIGKLYSKELEHEDYMKEVEKAVKLAIKKVRE